MTDQMLDTTKLTPANENPWYVLLTLYGEHEGEEIDNELHDKNRAVWNAWSCQGLEDEAAAELAKQAWVDVGETRGWAEIATQVKREHRAEMEKRNDDKFTYPGFPEFEANIECSEIQFLNTVVLRNCIFTRAARFTSATFIQRSDFSSATFKQDVDFTSATFTNEADFDYTIFTRTAYFRSGTFTQRTYFAYTTFTQHAYFTSATFTQDAYFTSATFTRDADFYSATFTQDADFTSATFTQDADFTSATFTQHAYFSSATFTKTANFTTTTFTQDAYILSTTFTQHANFSSATFDGPAKFIGTTFGVRGADEICVPRFTEASFARLVSFRDATFVAHYPVLEGTEIRETLVVTAKPDNWPNANVRLLDTPAEDALHVPTNEVAKESCATLRHLMGKQGMPEEEHFFFRREMRFTGHIGGWFARLPYRLFGLVSGYGYSIERPALGLFWVFLAPLGVYLAALGPTNSVTFAKAMGLSFASIFKFFGFQRIYFLDELQMPDHWMIPALASAQTVLAFILLFFLGLGLRTRFRLR